MKRKLLTLLIGTCLILTMVPSAAFAETKTADATLLEEKLDEAAELINGQEIETDLYQLPNGNYAGREVYDLGDDAQLIVEVMDIGTDSRQAGMVSLAETSGSSDLWRDFGNRSFVAKATVTVSKESATLQLTNNYTLSANGIDIRNLVAGKGLSSLKVTEGTPQITDGSARTPGASDVNGNCKYTISNSAGTKVVYQLNSTVGYVALDKAGKRIKVRQSWSLTK